MTATVWGTDALESVPTGFLTTDWRTPATGATFDVVDPATEQPVAAVADCGPADALAALDAAAGAAPAWAASTSPERADVLHRLAAALRAYRQHVAPAPPP